MPLDYLTPAFGIEAHVHLVEAPEQAVEYHKLLLAAGNTVIPLPNIPEDDIEKSLGKPLETMKERNLRAICLSPRARTMATYGFHSLTAAALWAELCNNNIGTAHGLFPDKVFPVGMLPLYPGAGTEQAVAEMRRCVKQMGFIGFNLVLDPTGGTWQGPPLWDNYWWRLLRTAVELDVAFMLHGVEAANPNQHTTGSNYLCADVNAFEQVLRSAAVFNELPSLRIVIPHAGAVVGHIDRFRGLAIENKWLDPEKLFGKNLWLDTCAYGPDSMYATLTTVPLEGLVFASESNGAVKVEDPKTGYRFDDTKRHIVGLDILSEADLITLFEGNALKVFPQLRNLLPSRSDE